MDASARKAPSRQGFTLVELLVVVLIIGILVGLITAAAMRARVTALETTIATEITQLDMALKAYKEKFGEYPPDFTDQAAVLRHLRKAFPRYTPADWAAFQSDVLACTGNRLDVDNLTPASAMVFWLAGPPEASQDSPRLLGFSANPANPFDASGSRIPPLFEFDETRLVSFPPGVASQVLRYQPERVNQPYVYFRARNGRYDPSTQYWPAAAGVRPYFRVDMPEDTGTEPRKGSYFNDTSFQIISAGLDSEFGGTADNVEPYAPHLPTGRNLNGDGHFDNITNFARGKLEEEMQ